MRGRPTAPLVDNVLTAAIRVSDLGMQSIFASEVYVMVDLPPQYGISAYLLEWGLLIFPVCLVFA